LVARFAQAFGSDLVEQQVIDSLRTFVLTIRAGNSPWDRFRNGDSSAISESAKRGQELFMGKARCAACHPPPLFTDGAVHATGFGNAAKAAEPPKGVVTMTADVDGKLRVDAGKTKPEDATRTPSVRMLAATAPYGSGNQEPSLHKMVDYMLSGGNSLWSD